MTYFTANFETVLIRFYVLMGVVIASFTFGAPYLALLALPIFLSALLGITFFPKKNTAKVNTLTKPTIVVKEAA